MVAGGGWRLEVTERRSDGVQGGAWRGGGECRAWTNAECPMPNAVAEPPEKTGDGNAETRVRRRKGASRRDKPGRGRSVVLRLHPSDKNHLESLHVNPPSRSRERSAHSTRVRERCRSVLSQSRLFSRTRTGPRRLGRRRFRLEGERAARGASKNVRRIVSANQSRNGHATPWRSRLLQLHRRRYRD